MRWFLVNWLMVLAYGALCWFSGRRYERSQWHLRNRQSFTYDRRAD